MRLQLLQQMNCPVCEQQIDSLDDGHVDLALFGSEGLGRCPCCGQAVEDANDADYRGMAALWLERRALDQINEVCLRIGDNVYYHGTTGRVERIDLANRLIWIDGIDGEVPLGHVSIVMPQDD